MPGYRTADYQLVILPPEELRQKINQLKKEFGESYQAPVNTGWKPQLSLLRFSQWVMMEERIINRLKTVAMGYHPFLVEIRNFGSFPAHTIFLQVPAREPFRNLVRQLKPFQRLMKMDSEHKPHFIEEPYFTLARRLQPWQYEKGWQEYRQRHFSGRFIADAMLLLRRRKGESRYQIIERFEFQNLPVSTRQGELFG